jgi:hypothetical protein
MYLDGSARSQIADYLTTYTGVVLSGFRASPADQNNTVFLPLQQGHGWSRDLTAGVTVGKSTVYAACQFGLYARYDRVYVLGCDGGLVGDRLWHYGESKDISREQRLSRFAIEAEHWDWAARMLTPAERQRIVFASDYNKWGYVNAFSRAGHREIVREMLKEKGRDPCEPRPFGEPISAVIERQ